ncbi:hypothetical protein [Parafrankia elaeagni]|uniref:hypothetical protein n=1 Tax=Parafrankia elaeagni TaxID=222534 RepID=UPI0012B661A3|nr:hypothetical protein [Parafrankia elaeagni]
MVMSVANGRRPGAARRHGGLMAMVAVVALSACGGGDTSSAAGSTPTAAASTSSGTPSPAAEELGLWPDDYVLTAGPATAGFTGVPPQAPDAEVGGYLPAVAECLGVPAGDVRNEFDSASNGLTFVNGSDRQVTITSTASIVSDEQLARDLALMENPRFAECSGEVQMKAAEDYSKGRIEYDLIEAKTLPPPAGATFHLQLSVKLRSGGVTVERTIETLHFLVGRVQVAVMHTSPGGATEPRGRLRQIADQISEKLRSQQPRSQQPRSVEGRPREGGPAVHALGPPDRLNAPSSSGVGSWA